MRIVFIWFGFAALSFAQMSFVAEGRLYGGGTTTGLIVEVVESGGRRSLAKVPVFADSSFKIELPLDGRPLEFRVLNHQGDVIQVIYQSAQRGIPIELRLTEVPPTSTSQAAVSLKRLSFRPSSKLRRAFALSQKLETAGKKAESVAALQEIVKTEPAWFEAWVELGTRQAGLGESTAAADSLRQALAIDPNAAEVYPFLGLALLRSGHVSEAARTAEKALELRPDCFKSKYILGLTMVSERQPSLRAVALLAEVQSHFPEAMLPLAVLHLRLGQFEASQDAAWRYLHMAQTPRAELARAIWREASHSLQSHETR